MPEFTLHLGDCLDVLRGLPDNSVDAVVTDPPYGLRFMGKRWDYDVPSVDVWAEVLRVLKPGGHLLSFGGTRTFHRMVVNIEDAGFEVRDTIAWVYGSGFPKSADVSKAIDREAGAEREVVGMTRASIQRNGTGENWNAGAFGSHPEETKHVAITAPATPAAVEWAGWGTALKPAMEMICLARKPLSEPTVAKNVLRWGTGALNIDGARVGTSKDVPASGTGVSHLRTHGTFAARRPEIDSGFNPNIGRFPANLIHDGSAEVLAGFPMTTSGTKKPTDQRIGGYGADRPHGCFGTYRQIPQDFPGDSGSAARFFYCAKASRADRDEGCEGLEERSRNEIYGNGMNTATKCDPTMGHTPEGVLSRPLRHNPHPTVKPTALMRYLVRLVTPPGGTVLDPYMGSGSTGKACALEGFGFVGIELDPTYFAIAEKRIAAARAVLTLPLEQAAQ